MTRQEFDKFIDELKTVILEHPIIDDWWKEVHNRRLAEGLAETNTPQTGSDKVVCPNCGRSDYIRSFEDDFHIKSEFKYKCINCNTYIKDEPQTDCPKREPTMEEISDNCVGVCDFREKAGAEIHID